MSRVSRIPRLKASYTIIKELDAVKNMHPIGEITVDLKEQPCLSLGSYSSDSSPKEFAIHIHPAPDPGTIVTEIISLEAHKGYELVLYIANHGNKAVNAKVWQM